MYDFLVDSDYVLSDLYCIWILKDIPGTLL